jgi:hypothetical protein
MAPSRKSKRTTTDGEIRHTRRTRLPEGFELGRATFHVELPDVREVHKALAGAQQRDMREDATAVRGVLRTPELLNAHAHFSASRQPAGDWAIEYEIVRGPHGKHESAALDAAALFKRTKDILDLGTRPLLMSLHFVLPLDRWRPPVTIPFAMPATLAAMPGNPVIAGLDFAFPETDSYGPRRVFVTTYEKTKQLVIRILSTHQPILGTDLTMTIVQSAREALEKLATKRATDA